MNSPPTKKVHGTKRAPTSVVFSAADLAEIKRAAALEGVSVSDFIRALSVKAAARVITRRGHERRCAHCRQKLQAA